MTQARIETHRDHMGMVRDQGSTPQEARSSWWWDLDQAQRSALAQAHRDIWDLAPLSPTMDLVGYCTMITFGWVGGAQDLAQRLGITQAQAQRLHSVWDNIK